MDFSNSLKCHMKDRGLSKKETAIGAGLGGERSLDSYVSAIQADPSSGVLRKLAAFFGCSMDKAYDYDFDESRIGLKERTVKQAKLLDSLNEHNYSMCMAIVENAISLYAAVDSSEKIKVEHIPPENREPLESKKDKKNSQHKAG